jgi:hypothetical protein
MIMVLSSEPKRQSFQRITLYHPARERLSLIGDWAMLMVLQRESSLYESEPRNKSGPPFAERFNVFFFCPTVVAAVSAAILHNVGAA